MAQVKLLKINANGVPQEMSQSADDITLNSYTVQGGGPVLSGTGLDANNQDVSDVSDLVFNDPTAGTINQTAGNLIIDNIMAKERSNVMASGSDILFGNIGDVAAQLDAFKVPDSSALPTATPAASSTQGYLVAYNGTLYMWDGSAWNDLGVSDSANQVLNTYTAGENIALGEVVYISGADEVSLNDVSSTGAASRAIGLAKAAATSTNPVEIISEGVITGLTGLTAGARYFADAATPGGITATAPSSSGNVVVQIGYAKSTTALQLQIQRIAVRT